MLKENGEPALSVLSNAWIYFICIPTNYKTTVRRLHIFFIRIEITIFVPIGAAAVRSWMAACVFILRRMGGQRCEKQVARERSTACHPRLICSVYLVWFALSQHIAGESSRARSPTHSLLSWLGTHEWSARRRQQNLLYTYIIYYVFGWSYMYCIKHLPRNLALMR